VTLVTSDGARASIAGGGRGPAPLIRVILAFAALCVALAAHALVPVPPLKAHVTDLTGSLSPEQQASLEQTLAAFEARKGSQLAVLMVKTTEQEPIEQYALRVAEQWKLGRKKVDDGAVLVVATQDRALRIEVGYGLEGALSDVTSKRIIDEVIIPRFQQLDVAGGIAAGVDRMIRVIDGEPLPAPPQRQRQATSNDGGGIGSYLPVIIVAALVVGGALRAILGRLLGAVATGGLVGAVAWWMAGAMSVALIAGLVAMFFTLFGGMGVMRGGGIGGLGGFGGFGGGGGRGGGGGGGFSGGGGGFGGGGASGRW
jgi:uncharacterized protein